MSPAPLPASDGPLFHELGSVASESAQYSGPGSRQVITALQVRDSTGALATWEWMRNPDDRSCELAPYCAQNNNRTVLWDGANYVLVLEGAKATKAEVADLISKLPERRESSLPPLLSFIPHTDLVPNSARYVLGPVSLSRVAPELTNAQPGFDSGAEAHYTSYKVNGGFVRLALFYYPTPEMARAHTVNFKLVPGTSVKRSGVLVAVVLPGATQQQGDTLLSQIEYEGRITWNETQQANPVSDALPAAHEHHDHELDLSRAMFNSRAYLRHYAAVSTPLRKA